MPELNRICTPLKSIFSEYVTIKHEVRGVAPDLVLIIQLEFTFRKILSLKAARTYCFL